MKIKLKDNLPFTTVSICLKKSKIQIKDILIDTGSATTVISVDILSSINIRPEPDDKIRIIRGIGGTETVFSRVVDYIQVGNFKRDQFEIEVAGLDYGFGINGILGMDFLVPYGAVLNLKYLELIFTQ